MYQNLHYLLLCVYAAAPIFYTGLLLDRWYRRRSRAAMKALGGTATAALVLGGGMSTFFALAVGARVRYDQVLLATFFFVTVLVVMKGVLGLAKVAAVRIGGPRPHRAVSAGVHGILIVVLAIPYVMSAVMTYRPKVGIVGDPASELSWAFEAVTFPATDGVKLSGWWIPGSNGRAVLVCHGLGANKLNQLHVARRLHARGYGVLTFDFRAHGGSGGQFTTFGDHERRDVLGAVRYLKTHKPEASRRIVAVGASLGAAAMIAAAADPKVGSQIDALVVYATYADLGELAREVCDGRFPWPLNYVARYGAVPLASAHAGVDLQVFAPARLIGRVAPRPVLIVHGKQDEIIPFEQGRALFDAAGEPRELIPLEGGHNDIIEDEGTARRVVEFLDHQLPG
jgi:fermentation-respiration switch protein FrsA (DUF1100 family)